MAQQITDHEDARRDPCAGLMLTTEAMVSNLQWREPKGASLRSGDLDDLY